MGLSNLGDIFSILLYLGISIGLIAYSVSKLIDLNRLRKSGELCKGEVTNKREDSDGDGTSYYFSYGFKDSFGHPHKKEIFTGRKSYDSVTVGQSIDILYERDKPQNSYPAGTAYRKSRMYTLFFMLIIGFIFFYLGYTHTVDCLRYHSCNSY